MQIARAARSPVPLLLVVLVFIAACGQQSASAAPPPIATPSVVAEFAADNPADLTI